jgi:hypothetical protein
MSALSIIRDYDGRYKVKGYEELRFSTLEDAEAAAELALYYFVDRQALEMEQDRRYRQAAEKGLAPIKSSPMSEEERRHRQAEQRAKEQA